MYAAGEEVALTWAQPETLVEISSVKVRSPRGQAAGVPMGVPELEEAGDTLSAATTHLALASGSGTPKVPLKAPSAADHKVCVV